MEDTTFATFVVGAASGSLVWYWLRRFTRNLGADEDILPSWLRPGRSIGLVEILISISLVGVLLYLSLILLEVPWTSRLGYWHNLATREPIGYLLLGFLFGLLLGEWLSYIFLPPQLRTVELRDSHTRWGYFLVGIVALGLLYPLLLPVLRTLKGGDVKTPVGSLSFGVKEPEKGANILQGLPTVQGLPPANRFDQLIDKNRPLNELPFFKYIAGRDIDYAELFLNQDNIFQDVEDTPKDVILTSLKQMHDMHKPFIDLMQTFGKCMKEHWDRFHSVEMISQQIRPLLPIHAGLVQGRDNRLGLLKKAVTKASHGLAADIILAESDISTNQIDPAKSLDENVQSIILTTPKQNKISCLTAPDKVNELLDTKLDLPYAAFALAHLFYDAGDHQQAARVVADWLDAQYSDRDQFAECNKHPSDRCVAAGDKYPIGYRVSGEWKPLPIWYRIRMEYELGVILEGTDATRSIVEAYKQLEASYKELFPAENWMDHCNEAKQHHPLKARLVLAYLSTVAERIQYQAAMIDSGLAPVEEVMTEQVRKDGKMITGTKFDCFYAPLVTQDNKEDYEGTFYARYGTVLALSATAKDASWEIARIEQKQLLTDARLQLEKAVQILKPRAEDERGARHTKALGDQLFYLGPSQDALRSTQDRLDKVNQALR